MTDHDLHPFARLTPDVVQDALGAIGVWGDGRMSALNSFENRVYHIHLDEAIEGHTQVVAKSTELAQRLGFDRMGFLACTVAESLTHAALPATIDVVTALHACDTATDDAIAFGLARQARAMVLVPCCQAEVASVMRQHKALQLNRTPLAELWRHPLHTREFGSQITNVLRCLQLEAHGYQVTVTELVGWEHSMKNELILARKTDADRPSNRARARERLQQVLEELGLQTLESRFAANGD